MSTPHNNPPDDVCELLRDWQDRGDREALDRLLAIEITWLKARIRAHGLPRADGEISVSDVAQEAVMRMLRVKDTPTFQAKAALRAYLWKAAWNLLAERLRQRRGETLSLDDSSQLLDKALVTTGGLGSVESRDRAVALQVTMQLLEAPERDVLELVYGRGLGIDGAAESLAIGKDAAKMRCARARAKLAQKLRRWSEIVG